jgi:hypothetical protein
MTIEGRRKRFGALLTPANAVWLRRKPTDPHRAHEVGTREHYWCEVTMHHTLGTFITHLSSKICISIAHLMTFMIVMRQAKSNAEFERARA